jgi:hypothetical protein
MRLVRLIVAAGLAWALVAGTLKWQEVGRSAAEQVERERVRCLAEFCAGDQGAPPDTPGWHSFKINGVRHVVPAEYGGYGGSLGFFWPSKAPMSRHDLAPEYVVSPDKKNNFYEVAIELFIRPEAEWPARSVEGYALIQRAEKNGWIARRTVLRPGLEQVSMKAVTDPDGYRIDYTEYFVATDLKGVDGLPPVASCARPGEPLGGGGTGFAWGDHTRVGVRMGAKHCKDWPEIYREIVRVLNLIKKG